MRVIVTSKAARIGGPRIGNSICSVRRDDVNVKIYEPIPGDIPVAAAHPVGAMARGTRKAIIDMPGVLGKARVAQNLRQVVALPAHRVGTVHAEIRAGIEISDHQPGAHRLAELVAALKKMRPLRAMRTIRPGAAKFAIVIAIVAVGTKDARPHRSP